MAIESKINITANDSGVSATINRITKNFNDAERNLKGFGGGLSSTLGSLSSFLNPTIAVSAAITGVTTGLGMMIKSSIDVSDQISKMSQKVGVSVEDLSTLNYVAELSDVDLESLGSTLAKLNRNITDTSRGQGEAIKAFKVLSIDVKDSNGNLRSTDSILLELAEKFKTLPDGPQKTSLAMELMGRSGANMIPFLNLGADGINKLKDEARSLGLEISTKTARQAEEFNDSITTLKRSFTGIATEIMTIALPSLNEFTGWVNEDAIPALKEIVIWFGNTETAIQKFRRGVDEDVKEGVRQGLEEIGDVLNKIGVGQHFDIHVVKAENAKKSIQNLSKYYEEFLGVNKTLFGYAPYEFSLLTGEIDNTKNKITELTEEQKKLAEEWSKVNNSLSKEIATIGLSGFDLEIVKVQQKVDDLYKKFGHKKEIDAFKEYMTLDVVAQDFEKNIAQMFSSHELGIQGAIWGANALKEKYKEIPGALEKINDLIFNLRINNVAPQLDIEKSDKPNPLTPVNFDRSVYDAQIEAITQVTTFETASFLIREQGTMDMFSNMSQAAMSFYNATGQKSKQMFALYKMFAIGETTISAIQGAQNAYTWANEWGGPIAGAIAAAAAGLAGAGRVAEIAATQPGSKYSGSSSGGSYNPTSSNNYNNSNNTNNNQQTTVIIYSDGRNNEELGREVVEALEKYVGYGGTINIKSGLK